MTETMTRRPIRSLTAMQFRQLLQLGSEAAAVFSALPKREALAVRSEMVRLIDTLHMSSRLVRPPTDQVIGPEIRRVAERIAEMLRSTPGHEHSVVWACFTAAVRERQEMDEFAAAWVIALREGF